MADVALDKACALSLDIDPDSLRTEPHQYGMKEPVYRTECFPSEGIADDFKKRLQVLKNRQWELRVSCMTDAVPLGKVAELGASLNWNMPPELTAMSSPTAPAQTAKPASVVAGGASDAAEPVNAGQRDRGWVMKRAALIKKHFHQWSTIKGDFHSASENDLSKMAKAPGHGDWFEADALKWAEKRGKLTKSNDQTAPVPATPFTGLTHKMQG